MQPQRDGAFGLTGKLSPPTPSQARETKLPLLPNTSYLTDSLAIFGTGKWTSLVVKAFIPSKLCDKIWIRQILWLKNLQSPSYMHIVSYVHVRTCLNSRLHSALPTAASLWRHAERDTKLDIVSPASQRHISTENLLFPHQTKKLLKIL